MTNEFNVDVPLVKSLDDEKFKKLKSAMFDGGVVLKHSKIANEDLKFFESMGFDSIQNEEVFSDNNYGDLEKLPA